MCICKVCCELTGDMFPEGGSLNICGVGDWFTSAFTPEDVHRPIALISNFKKPD